MGAADAAVLWESDAAVRGELGRFDLVDRRCHQAAKFPALVFGNRCPQILDFRLLLADKDHQTHFGKSGEPGIVDQL